MGGVGLGGAGGDNVGHQVGQVMGWGETGAEGWGLLRRIMGGVQHIFTWTRILKRGYSIICSNYLSH